MTADAAEHPTIPDPTAGDAGLTGTAGFDPARASDRATVAVVVVHYRGLPDTLACVQSLREHAPGAPVLVVDNASPDGSGRDLAAAFAGSRDVAIVPSGHNLGFGGGCNVGIEHALARWPSLQHVLLLNPDAQLLPGALEHLLATAARHPDAGIVGARILRPDGSVWFEHGVFPRFSLRRFHRRAPAGERESEAGFVTGCCMLLDATLLRQGLRFHEPYFLYGEDADLCCEVRSRGWSLWVNRDATVVHREGGSQRGERVLDGWTAEQVFWVQRAKAMLARRRLSLAGRLAFAVSAWVLKPVAAIATGRGARWLGPYLRGLREGARGENQRAP